MSTSRLRHRPHYGGRGPDLRDQIVAQVCPQCPTTRLQFDVDGAYCPQCGTAYPMIPKPTKGECANG